jgi:hypothetical protein
VNKWLFPALTSMVLLGGCATEPRGAIPVVDSSSAVSYSERVSANRGASRTAVPQAPAQAQAMPEDSGVVVMVPGATGGSQPIQGSPAPASMPITPGPANFTPITPGPVTSAPVSAAPATSHYSMPAPTGIPRSSGALSADEQLDGPVLALLTTAQQQQSGGDYNGASSSLERAQRIAPREPQVLYRLAQVRLSQGDAAQAEQLAQRALTYAGGRPDLQASLWNTIAQAREKQGDAAGAAAARQKAKVGA